VHKTVSSSFILLHEYSKVTYSKLFIQIVQGNVWPGNVLSGKRLTGKRLTGKVIVRETSITRSSLHHVGYDVKRGLVYSSTAIKIVERFEKNLTVIHKYSMRYRRENGRRFSH